MQPFAPSPFPTPGAPRPAKSSAAVTIMVMVGLLATMGVAGAGAMLMLGGGGGRGRARSKDVGSLPQLASVQAQLRPLDACEMDYGRSSYRSAARMAGADCSSGRVSTRFEVSDAWANKGVAFKLRRSSAAARWEVLVDQDQVPFDDLVAALTELSPAIVASYPAALAEARRAQGAAQAAEEQRRKDEQARKDRARSSYPTR